MTKDLRNFPYRVVMDWLDLNVRSDMWTMGIRNIELPRSDQSAPFVDMVIYFSRRDDMDLFRERWAGKAREHKVKLRGLRAALYALMHPHTEMVAYEKSDDTPVRPARTKP